jgi:RNA polymerase sigma-70 factor (ECF subfamily)
LTPEDWKAHNDLELVVASMVGNLQAFDELARRYRSALLNVAEQIVKDAQAAEDIVQDALLLAFKALPQLDRLDKFAAWLHAITRHRAFRCLQEQRRVESRSDMDEILLTHSRVIARDPPQILVRDEAHNEVREAILLLPPEYQEVLRLFYWDDMPQQKIADFLNLPLTTVKWRLHKAKQMLKKHLTQTYERS